MSQENNRAFFLPVHSPKRSAIRQADSLKEKDLHITIGLENRDIYNVLKRKDSLILNNAKIFQTVKN